ncbi:MAG TPA: hypothetical protein VGM25_09855 [Caulobacteraceae bacterium]|jgi:DNA-binding beta-propeller fold protein YncE
MKAFLPAAALLTGALLVAPPSQAAKTAPSKAASQDKVYRLDRVTSLKGKAPGWDYLTLDPAHGGLYIGRRAGGVTVYDVRNHAVVGQVANSAGANIGLPLPQLGKGFTANGDGSTTVFDLATLKASKRVKLGDGADAVFFDPASGQLMFTLGDSQRLAFMDSKTDTVSGYLHLDSTQIEGVAPDTHGAAFVALRDKDQVAKVDVKRRALIAAWPVTGCQQPTSVAYDAVHDRVFVGCKGDQPVLAVLDGARGAVVAKLEIGRGNDGVKFEGGKIYASNGVDGNITVFDQLGPDQYRLEQAVTTRPIARTMAIDPASKRIWTVTAEGMVDPSRPVNRRAAPFYPNQYFDDTFVLLEYGLHPKPTAAVEED